MVPAGKSATIDVLPDYVLLAIFQTLLLSDAAASDPLAADPLAACMRVCKRWFRVVRMLPARSIGLGCSLPQDPFYRRAAAVQQSFLLLPQPPTATVAAAAAAADQQPQKESSPRTLATALGRKILRKPQSPKQPPKQQQQQGDGGLPFEEDKGGRGPLARLRVLTTIRAHGTRVYAQNWCRDSQSIATAGNDGRLLMHTPLGVQTLAVPLTSAWVMTCAVAPSRRLVGCGGLDHIVTLYDLSAGPEAPPFQLGAHTGNVSCIRFINDTRCISCSEDTTCRVWDVVARTVVARYCEHTGEVLCVEVSPVSEKVFASCSTDKTVVVWDERVHTPVAAMRSHEADVNNVCWADSGLAIASASDDGTFRIFDVRQRRELRLLQSPVAGYNTGVSLSSSGRFLFGACESSVLVWDTLLSRLLCTCNTGSRISCIDVSNNGAFLAASTIDGTTRIFSPFVDS